MSATNFFDVLSGRRVAMRFDFGRAMRLRHEAELLATPQTPTGSDWTMARPSDNMPEEMLPEGVWGSGGLYFTHCCVCERQCDVTEFIDDKEIDFTDWHGGCGPRCCP